MTKSQAQTRVMPTKAEDPTHASVLAELNEPADGGDTSDLERSATDDVRSKIGEAKDKYDAKLTEAKVKAKATKAKAEADVRDGIDAAKQTASDVLERGEDFYNDVRRDIEKAYADGYEKGRSAYERVSDRTSSFIEDNPLAVGALGLAAGVLIGALLPRTRFEDTRIGSYSDEAIGHAKAKGSEMVREARDRAEDMVERAADNIERTVKSESSSRDQSATN